MGRGAPCYLVITPTQAFMSRDSPLNESLCELVQRARYTHYSMAIPTVAIPTMAIPTMAIPTIAIPTTAVLTLLWLSLAATSLVHASCYTYYGSYYGCCTC